VRCSIARGLPTLPNAFKQAIAMASVSKWLNFSSYPAVIVFIVMGAFATLFAWSSYNLFHLAMANAAFLRTYGLMAVMEGGLLQLLGIVLQGALSLACYLGFKACEVELVSRWRNRNE
jgi:hypothetical protein